MNPFHFFIPAPNGIIETKKLNSLMRHLEKTKSKVIDYEKSGFDIDFDAKWCLQIYFKYKSGFIALKENDLGIKVWAYDYADDMKPTIFQINHNSSDLNDRQKRNLTIYIDTLYKSMSK